MKNNRKRRIRAVKTIAVLIMIVSVGAALCFGKMAYDELLERKTVKDYYEELACEFNRIFVVDITPTPLQTANYQPSPSSQTTETTGMVGSMIDFDLLRQTCPDAVAWISMEDSKIDYPVVQGSDNVYYMNHLSDGTPNSAGSIMMDKDSQADLSETITVIHGHHMMNNTMFGQLDTLGENGYFEAHPYFDFFTPQGDFMVRVIAVWTTKAQREGYTTSFESEQDLDDFVTSAKRNAVYSADVDISLTDHFILLSTCAYDFEDARYVVLGKIIGD